MTDFQAIVDEFDRRHKEAVAKSDAAETAARGTLATDAPDHAVLKDSLDTLVASDGMGSLLADIIVELGEHKPEQVLVSEAVLEESHPDYGNTLFYRKGEGYEEVHSGDAFECACCGNDTHSQDDKCLLCMECWESAELRKGGK